MQNAQISPQCDVTDVKESTLTPEPNRSRKEANDFLAKYK